MDKFRNKYRIPSTRLQNWDYGWNAAYFVTICTANRELFFGDIVETQNFAYPCKMNLSEIGEIADKYWLQIPEHFPFVKLDAHVVMPNHLHGIVIIDKPDDGRNHIKNDERNVDENVERNADGNGIPTVDGNGIPNVDGNGGPNVQTQNFASQPPPPSANKPPPKNKFGPQSQNLASIIRGFKTGVTKYARNNNIDFAWQSRYHDHIIRDNESFERIRNYIINNPKNWNEDKFNNGKEGADG